MGMTCSSPRDLQLPKQHSHESSEQTSADRQALNQPQADANEENGQGSAASLHDNKTRTIDRIVAKLITQKSMFSGVPKAESGRRYCRPSLYTEDSSGRVVFADPLVEECSLKDEELAWVVLPLLWALAHAADTNSKEEDSSMPKNPSMIRTVLNVCSYDLLVRVVRGYVNSKPVAKKWRSMATMASASASAAASAAASATSATSATSARGGTISKPSRQDKCQDGGSSSSSSSSSCSSGGDDDPAIRHVTAAAEALWRIVQWRSRPDIGASSLLRRPLKGAALFHKLWPFHFTGYDDHGHPVFVERTGRLKANAMVSQLSLEQIILLRAQVHELIEHFTAAAGLVRVGGIPCLPRRRRNSGELQQQATDDDGASSSSSSSSDYRTKHVHIVDLANIQFGELRALRNSIEAVFKNADDVYPSPSSLFVVNAPAVFRLLAWPVIKLWLHPQTVSRVTVLGSITGVTGDDEGASSTRKAAESTGGSGGSDGGAGGDGVLLRDGASGCVGGRQPPSSSASGSTQLVGNKQALPPSHPPPLPLPPPLPSPPPAPSAFAAVGIPACALPTWCGGVVREGVPVLELIRSAQEVIVTQEEEERPAALRSSTHAAMHHPEADLHHPEADLHHPEADLHHPEAAVTMEHWASSSSPTSPSTTTTNTTSITDPALASLANAVACSQVVETLKHGLQETLLEHIMELLERGEIDGSLEGSQGNSVPAFSSPSGDDDHQEEEEVALRVLQTSGGGSPAFVSRRYAIKKTHRKAVAGASSCSGWRDFFFAGVISALALSALARRGLA